jgi:hypothetical protein
LLRKLLAHTWIVPKIYLGANNQAGDTGAVVMYLGEPLFSDVFEGRGGCDAEADKEDVGLGVGKRPQSIVIFLPSSIEEAQRIWLVANPIQIGRLADGDHDKRGSGTVQYWNLYPRGYAVPMEEGRTMVLMDCRLG